VSDRTYAEAAEELGVKPSWLKAKAQAREIPHRRYGRLVRFADEDIAEIRAMHKAAPIDLVKLAQTINLDQYRPRRAAV